MYINNGQAYVPVCSNVTTIIIEESENDMGLFKGFGLNGKCHKDIKIQYKTLNSNQTKKGFLRNHEIITQNSKRIECTNTDDLKEIIIQNKMKITKKLNQISISNYTSSATKLKTRNNHLKNLFNHHSYLTNGTDIIANLDEFLEINNDIENFSNKKNNINDANFGQKIEVDTKKGGYFDNIFIGIGDFFSELFTVAKNIIFLIIILIFGYYLLKIIFKCSPLCFDLIKNIHQRAINNNDVHDDEL